MKQINSIIAKVKAAETKMKILLRLLEHYCKLERKTMRSKIAKRKHKSEVHAHSVIKPDGTLIGCIMSEKGAEKYARNHGGKVTQVVLRAISN